MKKDKRYVKTLSLILGIILIFAALPWRESLISALAGEELESVLLGGTESTQQGAVETIGEEPTETENAEPIAPEGQEPTEGGETQDEELAEQGDEPMVQLLSDDGRTIYFDTSGNGDSTHGWTTDADMYVYLVDGDSTIHKMTKSTRANSFIYDSTQGTLWEYEISADILASCTAVIFLPVSGWRNSATDYQWQTLNIDFSIGSTNRNFANPCFKLTGEVGQDTNMSKKIASCYNLELASQAGKPIQFVNMTNNSLGTVTAHFGGAGLSDTGIPMTDSANGLYKEVTIPDDGTVDEAITAYQTVYFTDESGSQLGEVYNFFNNPSGSEVGVSYDAATRNTFYYGVTEKQDGTLVSSWGALPSTNEASLADKKLYFDKLSFDSDKTWKLQIGDGAAVTLAADADDPNTVSYTFPTDTAATQQTLLTLIASDGTKYHFKWSDFGTGSDEKNLAVLSSNVLTVSGTYGKTNTVFFDATLSKLSYSGDSGVDSPRDFSIPKSDGTIRYYAIGDGKADLEGDMEPVSEYSDGTHTWSDVYRVDLPEGYTKITFASFDMSSATNYGGHGESTTQLDIPMDIKNPCFYADSSDESIYDGGTRSGYWDTVYSIRDAGQKKPDHTVVDIPQQEETRDPSKKYLQVTMYDFYTDYELNGSNRDNYNSSTKIASHRIYQPFRQFNQALSSYYEKNGTQSPLYWGNFQNYTGSHYSEISSNLNLYGSDNTAKLFYENNSMWDVNGNKLGSGNNATVGLVADKLDSNGNLMIETGSGTVKAPFLDESFLSGNNSKNTVLGNVYKDVSFPFTKKALKSQSDTSATGTVDYWVFYSADSSTNLRMKQTSAGNYFLDNTAEVVKGQTATGGVTGNGNFFPFNGSGQSGNARQLNYGFASKLQFTFRLTDDGKVTTTNDESVPIEFTFSGDDDVWIFIDGKLALDIGGGHGVVSGYLDFANKKYFVSGVKNTTGGGSSSNVTGSFTMEGSNTDEHTLTMFYMERGLWESNMEITYNFPDENTLEVEKQVDKTDVNDIFKSLFDNTSLFTFFIKNQATHYGTKEVETSGEGGGEVVSPLSIDLSACTLEKAAEQNTFALTSENTIHWKALMDDKTGTYRDLRYGSIKLSDTIDISKMKYLQFKFYYDYTDNPSLSHMYLYLVDSGGKTQGGSDYLSGKTYGAVTMKGKTWITVKIDLEKLQEAAGFDAAKLSEIRFGYNYSRDFYLEDFVFSPSATYTGKTGFVTKQSDIPDYGSAASGQLEIPVGAQYASSIGGNYAIGEDGMFVLQNGESVSFNDQFRRGSYIALREDDSEAMTKLFTTSWTMYENGRAVTSMIDGTTIDLDSSITSLFNVSGSVIDDGRTEVYKNETDADNQTIANSGYTQSIRPKDKNPAQDPAFVFRSYSYPDTDSSGVTKLKAVFTNKVKVGSMKITKDAAYDLDKTELKGVYTFKITYTNVGGLALENEAVEQTITLRYGESYTITGIPLGTSYTVDEITATDGSTLDSVVIAGDDSDKASFAPDTKVVSGTIDKETTSSVPESVILTFKNTKKPTINVSLEKLWEAETGEVKKLDSIWVQLQRRKEGTTDPFEVIKGADNNPDDNYKAIEVKPGYDESGQIRWYYSITGLDKVVDYQGNDTTQWEYRFVELNPNDKTTVLEDKKTYVITKQTGNFQMDSETFRVTYSSGTTGGGTGDYSTTMTNTLLGPVNLEVHKTRKNEGADPTDLSGVTFKLEMQSIVDGQETWGYLPGKTEDATATTGVDGKVTFTSLKDGTYRLTEIKTAEGYTLLMKTVIIKINRAEDTYSWRLDGAAEGDANYSGKLIWGDENTRTLVINISNVQNIQLPFTGIDIPLPLLAGGVLLCAVSGVLYIEEVSRRSVKKKARRKKKR